MADDDFPTGKNVATIAAIGLSKDGELAESGNHWNQMLEDDPISGPSSGFVVGVTDKPLAGRYPLIWVAINQ